MVQSLTSKHKDLSTNNSNAPPQNSSFGSNVKAEVDDGGCLEPMLFWTPECSTELLQVM
jgi:hypothetical protein